MNDEQKLISSEKLRQDRICVFAGNNFVHGVAHGFESLKLLDLADDGGLIDADGGASAAGHGEKVEQVNAGEKPDGEGKSGKCDEDAE